MFYLPRMFQMKTLFVRLFKQKYCVSVASPPPPPPIIQFNDWRKTLFSTKRNTKYTRENWNLVWSRKCAEVVVYRSGKLRFNYTGSPLTTMSKHIKSLFKLANKILRWLFVVIPYGVNDAFVVHISGELNIRWNPS